MKKVFLIVVWLTSCALLGYYAPTLPVIKEYISIREVTVEGTDKLSEEDIKDLVKSESWFFVTEERLEKKARKYTFIQSINIDKPAFGVVRIHVTERKPYGLVRTGDRMYVIDETGNLLDDLSYYKDEFSDLKLITVDEENFNQETLKKVKEVELSLKDLNIKEFIINKSVITAITEDDKIVILSKENTEDSVRKFNLFNQKRGIKEFSYLNFSFDSMVIVKK